MPPKKNELDGTMNSTLNGTTTMQHTQFGIQVAARMRPFNKKELADHASQESGPQPVVDVEGNAKNCTLLDPTKGYAERANFQFDHIFSAFRPSVELQPNEDSDDDDDEIQAERAQAEIYKALGAPIVESAWQGYNGCIFAYGQTSSGKTYTMMGTKRDPGIIPRLCRSLFEKVEEEELNQQEEMMTATPPTPPEGASKTPNSNTKRGKSRKIIKCEVSYMEIYNEKVKDLLKPKTKAKRKFNSRFDAHAANDDYENLRVRQHPLHGPFVEGITKKEVGNWLECVKLIRSGNEERSSATTDMNESSSRSHAIFQMVLTQTEALGAKVRGKEVTNHKVSKINLVDLAGSERITRTNVTGVHVTEANYINKSLATLRKVIDVLVTKKSGSSVVIPYRESLLTWILSDNFGGNSKTVMVANVSPHHTNYLETESTLRYATLAKGIINRVRVNEDPSAKLIRELQAQLKTLQNEMGTGPQQMRVKELEEQMEENKKAMEELIVREEGMRQLIQESRSREERLRHEKEDLIREQDHWKNEAEKLRKEKEELRDQLRKVAEGGKFDKDLLLSNNKSNFWMEDDEAAGTINGVTSPVDADDKCPPQHRRGSVITSGRRKGSFASKTKSSAAREATVQRATDEREDAAGAPPEEATTVEVENKNGTDDAAFTRTSTSSTPIGTPPDSHPRYGRRAATEEGKEREKPVQPAPAPATAEARAGRRRPQDSLDVLTKATSSSPVPPSTVPITLQHLAGPSGTPKEGSPKVAQMPDALDSFLTGGGAQEKKSAVPPWRQRRSQAQ